MRLFNFGSHRGVKYAPVPLFSLNRFRSSALISPIILEHCILCPGFPTNLFIFFSACLKVGGTARMGFINSSKTFGVTA